MRNQSTPWMPFGLLAAGLLAMVLGGCGQAETERPESWLVRVGQQELNVRQFCRLFEASAEIPPETTHRDAEAQSQSALRLLNQIIEELVLSERARELGVQVTTAEFDAEVVRIRADYPDGMFDELLLDQAVSYPFWLGRLERRLLMQKLATHELEGRVALRPEEIADYYGRHYSGSSALGEDEDTPLEIEERIVATLRREKIEELYGPWLQQLKQRYPIQINQKHWQRLVSSGFSP